MPKFKVPDEFEIKHTHASVILGSYPLSVKVWNAVEFGSGNGVASIMMALLNTHLKIKAVDVDKKACEEAKAFVKLNQLNERIEVINMDVLKIPEFIGYESVDFVFFNPPFHISGKVSKNERRFLERNENAFEKFVISSFKILKNKGYFRMITSPMNLLTHVELLEKNRLIPKFFVPIYGKKEVNSKLILIEGVKNGKKKGVKVKFPVFLNTDLVK